jgi:hypothetical protein
MAAYKTGQEVNGILTVSAYRLFVPKEQPALSPRLNHTNDNYLHLIIATAMFYSSCYKR